jgi:uncharacterized protein involved in type VI secretion and phage assembly
MPNDQAQLYVKLGGTDAPAEFYAAIEQITVESSLHLPDVATIVLSDPQLKWTDNASLDPGKELKILGKAAKKQGGLFDGEIVEVELDMSDGEYRAVVRAFDRLHRLTRGQHVRSFLNMSDADIIAKVAREAGLQAKVGPAAQVHEYVLQNNESNLAFLQRRAAALGFLLYADGKRLHCEAPTAASAPIELKPGETLFEFRPRVSTVGQAAKVTVRGWDPKAKREVVGQATNGTVAPKVGANGDGSKLAKKISSGAELLVTGQVIRNQEQAKKIAQAVANRAASQGLEAEGICVGTPKLVAGEAVKISNMGTRFSGSYMVTSATHTYIAGEGYRTQFSVSGLNAHTLVASLLPEPARPNGPGLVIAVVTDNKDPEGKGRVKLKFPWLSGEHASSWARVLSMGGGATRGFQVLPAVNDEVLVGFEHGDIDHPYVIGGLWNGKDAPPKKNDQVVKNGQVNQWLIRTRSGHELVFDEGESDKKGQITIKTAGGHLVRLSDKDKALELKTAKHAVKLDDQGNLVALSSGGDLQIKATGKLQLQANGKLEITGTGGLDLKSNAALSMQANAALDIKSNATASISANAKLDLKSNAAASLQANAMLEVKSSAILNIQGTLVKIN